jgi:hypothetical protein
MKKGRGGSERWQLLVLSMVWFLICRRLFVDVFPFPPNTEKLLDDLHVLLLGAQFLNFLDAPMIVYCKKCISRGYCKFSLA